MSTPSKKDIDKELEELKKKTPLLNWGKLRFVGSLRILSVVPFVGAGIVAVLNLPQFSQVNAKLLLEDVWTIGALFAFLILLFSANVLYHIFCPPVIKRFESLADLYQQQLSIKKSQMETYPDDIFKADLKHVAEFYVEQLGIFWLSRWACILLFVFSLVSLFYFLYKFRLLLIDT